MKKKSVSEMVSKEVVKTLKDNNIRLAYDNGKESKKNKYSKAKNHYLFEGYDLLELLIVVRPYIKRKYKIGSYLLEMLLYLNGKKFFTQHDFGELPKQLSYSSMRNILKTGYVVIIQQGSSMDRHVYTLSTSARNIVKEFYQLLSGEKKLPENSKNPLQRSKTTIDKKRMNLIQKINQVPAPEKKKPLYL